MTGSINKIIHIISGYMLVMMCLTYIFRFIRWIYRYSPHGISGLKAEINDWSFHMGFGSNWIVAIWVQVIYLVLTIGIAAVFILTKTKPPTSVGEGITE